MADLQRKIAELIEGLCRKSDLGSDSGLWEKDLISLIERVLSPVVCGIFAGTSHGWIPVAALGNVRGVPEKLIAEAADRDCPLLEGPWWIIPLGSSRVLALELPPGFREQYPENRESLLLSGRMLRTVIISVEQQLAITRRATRRQALLEAAKDWIGIRDWSRLFREIATTATQILQCERATLFLWDRRSKTLIGRPALGVPGEELRVPDDRGVVGQVLRTGRPARADALHQPEAIDRSVDARLGFTTRSVLCVPLVGKKGILGVLEVLNKFSNGFTDEDEITLSELAGFASAAVENAQEHQTLLTANMQMATQAAAEVELVGSSPAIEAIRKIIRRVANTDLAVLILGENGTGKEVVARTIHFLSDRRYYPFIPINCAAIPETLAESELFGHEKGAFTDAIQTRPGKFELAGKGTLFLDEIGELTPACQAKLLRVLEDKTFVRVGGSIPLTSEARILAATNQDLGALVREKRFREDLYYRLNVVTIELPPLRARKEDIPILARYFLQKFCGPLRRPVPRLTPAAEKALCDYSWPGNVRELRNAMERIAYLVPGEEIDVADLDFLWARGNRLGSLHEDSLDRKISSIAEFTGNLSEATRQFQRRFIENVLTETRGNLTEAARKLGLHRSNLYRKLRQLGLPIPRGQEK